MRLPTPDRVTDASTKVYLLELVKSLTTRLRLDPGVNTAADSVLLASPSGSVYSVKVTDGGVLETTLVYEKT